MKNLLKTSLLTLSVILLSQSTGAAMENKIKFDKNTYYLSNPDSKTQSFAYYPKNETIENWHTKIIFEQIPNLTNPTEAAAEFAHKIQEETKGASVLLYPDAAMTSFINFPPDKKYYDYSAIVFVPLKEKGMTKFGYVQRFYSSELGGQENARKAAIEFAEKNNKKYMEMVDKSAKQMKF